MASEGARARGAWAALVFAAAAPSFYVAHRMFEVMRGGAEDPALLVAQSHVGFYWRIGTALWLAAGAAGAALALTPTAEAAERRAARLGQWAPWLLAAGGLLAWRFP